MAYGQMALLIDLLVEGTTLCTTIVSTWAIWHIGDATCRFSLAPGVFVALRPAIYGVAAGCGESSRVIPNYAGLLLVFYGHEGIVENNTGDQAQWMGRISEV